MAEIKIDSRMFYDCPGCGNEVELGDNYCQECGEPLEWKEDYAEWSDDMGKSILILETPKCCGDCPLMDGGCIDEYCSAHGGDCIDISDMGGKPDWCPLRPLPERMGVTFDDKSIWAARRRGWNDCLDKITEDLKEEK